MARDGRETWARRLEQYRRSGLTTAEFARREGVSARTLSWWRWKLGGEVARVTRKAKRRRAASSGVRFVELLGATMASATASSGFEVELGAGYRIRVPAQFEADALARLLAVLEGR